jgi:hypothetical protein
LPTTSPPSGLQKGRAGWIWTPRILLRRAVGQHVASGEAPAAHGVARSVGVASAAIKHLDVFFFSWFFRLSSNFCVITANGLTSNRFIVPAYASLHNYRYSLKKM